MALPHAKPGESIDLCPLGEALKDARTQAIIKTDSFEAIRLVLQAGTEIPSHKVPGEITLHCLEGCVSLGLAGSVINLRAGEWLYLNGGEPHSVKAEEDSSLLLTIILKT
ncbi:MAG: cupin domain-containing protein [Rhodospirillales bacterium]|nr:cupin domain-containing protein [Rhodospirillales bacterium]